MRTVAKGGALPHGATWSGGARVKKEDPLSRRGTLSPSFRLHALEKGEERQRMHSSGAIAVAGGLEQAEVEECEGDGGSG